MTAPDAPPRGALRTSSFGGHVGCNHAGIVPGMAVDRFVLERWCWRLGGIGGAVAIVGTWVTLAVTHHDADAGRTFVFGMAGVVIGGGGVWLLRWSGLLSRRHWGVPVATLGLAVGSAALVMVAFRPTVVAGTLLLTVAPSAVVGGRIAAGSFLLSADGWVRGKLPGTSLFRLWLAFVVLLPVALLGAIGEVVRAQADYVGRFGAPVTVQLGTMCLRTTNVNYNRGTSRTTYECPVAYQLSGRFRSGSLKLADGEAPYGTTTVEAYALGRRLESRARVGDVSPVAVLGGYLPVWLLIGTLAEFVVIVLLVVQARPARNRRPAGLPRRPADPPPP
jgi:hypothetical protein